MDKRKLAGVREYARHRGVSHTAVRKAIATGRIAAAVVKTPGAKHPSIDVEAADLLWKANTDQSQQRPPGKDVRTDVPNVDTKAPRAAASSSSSTAVEDEKQEPPRVQPGRDLFDQELDRPPELERLGEGGEVSFASARVNREVWSGKLQELRYLQVAGELVSAARARELFFKSARNVRDALLALPVRLSHDLAAETSPGRVETRLLEEFEKVLQELSRGEQL